MMDLKKIEDGFRLVLEGLGENPSREGLLDTPARVARMYQELLSGLARELPDVINGLTPEGRLPSAQEAARWI